MKGIAGGSAATIVKEGIVVQKHDQSPVNEEDLADKLRQPGIWDDEFAQLLQQMRSYPPSDDASTATNASSSVNAAFSLDLAHTSRVTSPVNFISNLTATGHTSVSSDTSGD